MQDPTASAGGDDRLVFTREELLANTPTEEPLIAGGVRCHGGFASDGGYVSPRTLHRGPAIRAWQARLARDGHELVTIGREHIPPQYPNQAQAKLLLWYGARDPIVRALTIISIVEGFGAIIRDVQVPDAAEVFAEPVDGTALAHLAGGLFEAHARDESGWESEGGHKQMWEAARDLALEKPKVPGDVLMRIMGRRERRKRPQPLFPQLDKKLYRMLTMMAQVLVVEVIADATFDWGESVLSDPEVSADPHGAGHMVRFIRSDENPHVEYLRTALSEVRARTLRTVDGDTLSGRTVVDGILHRILHHMHHNRPEEQRRDVEESLARAIAGVDNAKALREEFDALASQWTPPALTGFESSADAAA